MKHILLKLSTFDKIIFWHDGSYFILGALGMCLGLFVGWLVCYKCREQANNLEQSNQKLREIYRELQDKQSQVDAVIDEL